EAHTDSVRRACAQRGCELEHGPPVYVPWPWAVNAAHVRAGSAIMEAVSSFYLCPHCGESVDTSPDLGGGQEQDYVEDCPVCCRPNRIHARYDSDEDDFQIDAESE